MNIKLLKQVRDFISRNPEKYDQSDFCGTACCIGGTAALLSRRITRRELAASAGDRGFKSRVADMGAEALGLDDEQADILFSSWSEWPSQFRIHYSNDSKEVQAKKAVKRINHFIRTKGAE